MKASIEIPLGELAEVFDNDGNLRMDAKGRPIRKRRSGRVLKAGKEIFHIQGAHTVEIKELPDDHASEMLHEVRIVHPEGMGAPEVHRFLDEKNARDHFETFVRVIAAQSAHEAPGAFLEPATFEGKKVADSDEEPPKKRRRKLKR